MLKALFFLILLAPSVSMAQTPVSEQVANAYYETCASRDDPRLSDESQEALCSCMSVKMMSAMTLEDLAAMKPAVGPGRTAFDKMLTEVYAPCMKIPTQDVLHRQCMNDRKVQQFSLRDPDRLCRCTAGRMGEYLDKEAQPTMHLILRYHPDITDPMDFMLNNVSMRQRAEDFLFACLKE